MVDHRDGPGLQFPDGLRGPEHSTSEDGKRFEPEGARIEMARALTAEAVELEELDRAEEALAGFRRVIVEFGRAREPEVRDQVAFALLRTGLILCFIRRRSESLAALGALLKSFERGESTAIDECLEAAHDRYQKLIYGRSR